MGRWCVVNCREMRIQFGWPRSCLVGTYWDVGRCRSSALHLWFGTQPKLIFYSQVSVWKVCKLPGGFLGYGTLLAALFLVWTVDARNYGGDRNVYKTHYVLRHGGKVSSTSSICSPMVSLPRIVILYSRASKCSALMELQKMKHTVRAGTRRLPCPYSSCFCCCPKLVRGPRVRFFVQHLLGGFWSRCIFKFLVQI